jgi:orotate phosphoribosyltransferase
MQVPSGRTFTKADLDLLRRMADVGFIKYSDKQFQLKSGIMSNVYVFGREDLTDHPELEWIAGRKIAQVVYENTLDDRQPCLIGLPTAGTALAQAASMASVHLLRDRPLMDLLSTSHHVPIAHRIMREQLKSHGSGQHKGTWVNGRPDHMRQQYWTVDNVVTDGDTKVENARRLESDGYPAFQMPVLIYVDRQQGAVRRLKDEGFEKIIVVFELLDVTFAFGEMDLWPKTAVASVEEEIKAHQLV